ncbi:putative disease resistance RPP13-like protein 1 isoform X2 [Glycine soja]|uniref:putative disease resistance RPP13-like protein 1 isoform X2 n=1 Tax=Glycine soja TaxID=3848 RepID=UPI0010400CAD|nr:putative disease resistance RPP13-like protein 1 isoform X2 [Glycine soja]
MAELVGGAFLSAFLNVVFDKLATDEVVDFFRGKKVDLNLLENLKSNLSVVGAVLDDAEKKQIKLSSVNQWLIQLKDVLYDADDVLDEISTKAATQKKVSKVFSRFTNRKMASKLEKVVGKLDKVLEGKKGLPLQVMAGESNEPWNALPTTSLEDGYGMYGRDTDKEAIMELVKDSSDGVPVSVIAIVGMGGVGKTTLARSVFNDGNLKEMLFDLNAWVCVSDQFDIVKVTKTMIEQITQKSCKLNDLNLLQHKLMDRLKDKKFLIVLDDVWIEDDDNWSNLTKPLLHGTRGSKILFTTRNENVVNVVPYRIVQVYPLSKLSNEDCWLVLANHAFPLSESSGENRRALEEIGREIVKKCNGLPLAARSLGGMLRREHAIRVWNNTLESDIWKLSESQCKVIPALRISYQYLPPHLKRCFVYCSLYPKDYEFQKNDLILLWMAEDLLKLPNKGKALEIGYEYFDDLVSRSFFQRSSNRTRGNYFVMHDLVHDLALYLGGEFYFRSEELGKETKIGMKTRHLSVTKFSDPISDIEVFNKLQSLRTFLAIDFKDSPFNKEKEPGIVVSKLKCLRVLSFCGFASLDVLHDSIGKLIHLRYLNLSRTSIKTLPESLCNLYNLQTLVLSDCDKLTRLPTDMQNLINLCHLHIDGTDIREMPRGMGMLSHLQHLDFFIVGKHKENGIKELGTLSNLHGSLSIRNLENVTRSNEALEARMLDKKHINHLSFLWSNGTDFQTQLDVLCKLKPHQGLESLTILGYDGTIFPDWVGNFSYHNMTSLSLRYCDNCCVLPSLGQLPFLKELYISNLDSVKTVDAGFYKNEDCLSVTPFSSLETLSIVRMYCLELWSTPESDAFPLLKSLTIENCPKLRGDLPNHLPALKKLKIASSLPRAPTLNRLEIRKSNNVSLHVFPLLLEWIEVEGSQMVESMIKAITSIEPTCLQHLKLSDCSSAISFPGGRLPASLKALHISNLKNLELPTQHKHELLESLSLVNSCYCLRSLPLATFPNLKRLEIRCCEHLKSLLVSGAESFKSLCSLSSLLPKLEYLHIEDCPEIESFPEGGMPPNLRTVEIDNCEKLLSGLAWPSMGMLTHLIVWGPCDGIKSFPKEGLLPPSLTSLKLYYLLNLEMLDCMGLLHLTSLQELTIEICPLLENMVGERLPVSLIKLTIERCPLLEKQCRRKHPQIWPKISHIRHIKVDNRWI